MSTTGFKLLSTTGLVLFVNALFAIFLYSWINESDFKGVPNEPTDKFYALFYYASTTFTTTGYGDIVPISRRARLVTALYMIMVGAGLIAFIRRII
jgi:voltage-gated potassium channel Kch